MQANVGKEELMKRRKYIAWGYFCRQEEKEEKELEENILKLYFWQRRRRTEREKEANIWRKKYISEEKSRGGRYLKTGNIFLAEENKEQGRKRRNIIGEGKEEQRRKRKENFLE